jgi:SAM-dependent methyltransferase
VIVRWHPHDFAGGDHVCVAGRERPHLVAELECAGTSLEVREHEEVMRVGVVIRRIADRQLGSREPSHGHRGALAAAPLRPVHAPHRDPGRPPEARRAGRARVGAAGLEIGCGTGNLALLVKRTRPQLDVVGLDPDPKALARADRKARRAGLALELDRGFADELPYPDASFDRVLSAFMFHHLEADLRPATLREVARVLRPGGSLHLLDFGGHPDHLHGLMARLARRSHALLDNWGDRIPTLMREADLTDPTEIGRLTKRIGRLSYYRAHRAA